MIFPEHEKPEQVSLYLRGCSGFYFYHRLNLLCALPHVLIHILLYILFLRTTSQADMLASGYLTFHTGLFFHIHKLSIVRHPNQIYGSNGAVPLFCDANFCYVFILRILIIVIVSVDKHYHVRILFNSP